MSRKPIYFALVLCALVNVLLFIPRTTAGAADPIRCIARPDKPILLSPAPATLVPTHRVVLEWDTAVCATTYIVVVKQPSYPNHRADRKADLTGFFYKTKPLAAGLTYKWFVRACNFYGCTRSDKRTFTIQ